MTQKELDRLQNQYMKDMIDSIKELFSSEMKAHRQEIKKDRESDRNEINALKMDVKEFQEATVLYRALYKYRKTVLVIISVIVTASITVWKYLEPFTANIPD